MNDFYDFIFMILFLCYFTLIVGRQFKKLKEVLSHVNRTLVVSSSFTIALLQL